MKNKTNILISVMVISFLVIFQNGCGIFKKKEKEWKPVTYKTAHFIHSVKWPGETIKIIAKWYTGDITNWKAIADANPVIDPNFLYTGNIIYIPQKLLKTKDPMPKRFIAAYGKRTQKKAAYNKKTEKKAPGHKTPKYKKPEYKNQKNEASPLPSSTLQEPENDQQGDDEIELFGPK